MSLVYLHLLVAAVAGWIAADLRSLRRLLVLAFGLLLWSWLLAAWLTWAPPTLGSMFGFVSGLVVIAAAVLGSWIYSWRSRHLERASAATEEDGCGDGSDGGSDEPTLDRPAGSAAPAVESASAAEARAESSEPDVPTLQLYSVERVNPPQRQPPTRAIHIGTRLTPENAHLLGGEQVRFEWTGTEWWVHGRDGRRFAVARPNEDPRTAASARLSGDELLWIGGDQCFVGSPPEHWGSVGTARDPDGARSLGNYLDDLEVGGRSDTELLHALRWFAAPGPLDPRSEHGWIVPWLDALDGLRDVVSEQRVRLLNREILERGVAAVRQAIPGIESRTDSMLNGRIRLILSCLDQFPHETVLEDPPPEAGRAFRLEIHGADPLVVAPGRRVVLWQEADRTARLADRAPRAAAFENSANGWSVARLELGPFLYDGSSDLDFLRLGPGDRLRVPARGRSDVSVTVVEDGDAEADS